VDLAQALLEAGGIAPASVLLQVVTRHDLRAAVKKGLVVSAGRGRYSLPDVDEHRAAAAKLSGALCLLSAARHWGWPVKLPPEQPQVLVPRGRNVAAARRKGIDLRWGEVTAEELAEGVTSKVRTVLDCARSLPFDAALAVVDSALRDGMTKTELLLACSRLARKGRSRAFRVIELGDHRAANPFESVLRAIVHEIIGAHFEPQVWVGNIGRADLVDRRRRVVVEGDSFEFHSEADALNRDMVRYNAFLGEGHVVLRFGWQHAMFEQDYVRATVTAVLEPQGRSVRWCPRCDAA
jgi:very-short-patch-repair endonuclease